MFYIHTNKGMLIYGSMSVSQSLFIFMQFLTFRKINLKSVSLIHSR